MQWCPALRAALRRYSGEYTYPHTLMHTCTHTHIHTYTHAPLRYCQSEYVESLQFLRYQKGQKFDLHHDSGVYDEDANTISVDTDKPLRVGSVFLYLNDLEEEAGGETVFPQCELTVRPKAGRALVWSNVRPRDSSR